MKIGSVNYLIGEGFENVWRNKIMAFASYCVLLVSILLVGFSFLFAININGIIGDVEDKNEIVVYIGKTDPVTKEYVEPDYTAAPVLETQLLNMDNIDSIVFYSKEQGFEDMKDQLEANGTGNVDLIFSEIEKNPLPDAYRIKVKDVSQMEETVGIIRQLDNVFSIYSPSTFADVLVEVRKIVTFISIGILAAMGIISVVIIYNSAQVSVFARRKEINIMKYVGATNAFIRLPFFVEGLVIGLLSGITAVIITWFSYDYIISAISKEKTILLIIQNGLTPFEKIAFPVAIAYILSGALIGSLGTLISVRRHLDV